MSIGKLRHRIQIEERSRSADGQGGYTETWSNYATVWAKVRPMSSKERFFTQQVNENTTHEIRIRYLSGVDSSMRIDFEGRKFAILGIRNEMERDKFMVIEAKEGAGN